MWAKYINVADYRSVFTVVCNFFISLWSEFGNKLWFIKMFNLK